jgi:hypothetical protein
LCRPQIHPIYCYGYYRSVEVYRNPRRTDWESFRTDLSGSLCKITDKITDFAEMRLLPSSLKILLLIKKIALSP